jgi:hypothetical protein
MGPLPFCHLARQVAVKRGQPAPERRPEIRVLDIQFA